MKHLTLTAILLLISFTALAMPNAVLSLDPHYDKQHNLVTPDKILLAKAIRAYQDGYNKSALTKFHQSAAFGNSIAQKHIGLMYLKALGTNRDWSKGYAWIKLAALDGTDENLSLMRSIYAMLTPLEIKQAKIEYQKISEDYDISATLKRRDRWVKKQKRKATGTRTGSQTTNIQSQAINGVTLDSDRTSKMNSMDAFVNNYQFGVVEAGEIKLKDE